MTDLLNFSSYIQKKIPIHMIGIGGVSMASIAKTLHSRGAIVRGSDMAASPATEELSALGIAVMIGHDAAHLSDAGLVIYSAAIHEDNPERQAALSASVPMVERAVALGALMDEYAQVICVSGTHGKSSTTAMISVMAMALSLDPTIMLGATLPQLGSGLRLGESQLFIAEACEYSDSFLQFSPNIAVILNVEHDHLDYFPTFDDFKRSFSAFAEGLRPGGTVCVNADDENACLCAVFCGHAVFTFGIHAGMLSASNISYSTEGTQFDLVFEGKVVAPVSLRTMGEHNVLNALGAMAALYVAGYSFTEIAGAILQYTGISRRFEYRGMCKGAAVIDDYAHHPGEITATLQSVKSMGFKRVFCVFQPHTYTRAKGLLEPFAQSLALADQVVLAEIYAARETNPDGFSSKVIADKIDGGKFFDSFPGIASYLLSEVSEGDLILTMGAGDVYKVIDLLPLEC